VADTELEDLDALMVQAGADIRLHPILSNEEVLKARANARKKLDAERHAAAMRAVEEQELERLRVEEGMTTGVEADDAIVSFTVDLPTYADRITLSGRPYYHGRRYDVPLHVARTLADEQFKAWRHDEQMEGKSIHQKFTKKHNTMINARSGSIVGVPAMN
jgi:hypothetical protein